METLKKNIRDLLRYPSAIVGLIAILILISVAIVTMIAIPYNEAIRLWRGGEDVWYQNPKYAPPAWLNWFSSKKQPESFSIKDTDPSASRVVTPGAQDTGRVTVTYKFNYNFDSFPQELSIYFTGKFDQKQPFASVYWYKPNGDKVKIVETGIGHNLNFRFSQDEKLIKRLNGALPMESLFQDPKSTSTEPMKGEYKLEISGITFEKNSDMSAEFVLYGQLFGLAGTDHQRRDLVLPLLWGVPIALAFGLIASLGTSVLTMFIAALGAWFGGWVDELIQRITEINLVLPFLPILIIVGTFFSRSIWTILGVTILLSIFTGAIKGYRAIFLQVKESTYIEAARAYGAGNTRIIVQYLLPRMIPLLIPGLVSSIPSFVFLEASLAVLGLGDPVLPTWGKIIEDAQANGALYKGLYYWIMEPAALLMFTGLGFAMLGYSLDRIFNPRLRGL